MATPMHPVNSSQISYIGYDKEENELFVKFKNGTVYRYDEVPESVYADMMKASSIGSYFIKHIKNEYIYIKL